MFEISENEEKKNVFMSFVDTGTASFVKLYRYD